MRFMPRPYQQACIDHATAFLSEATSGDKVCYAAPTGCGKSIMELALLDRFPNMWMVTPRQEIIDGMMDKMGVTGDSLDYRISTPIRLRNRLMEGSIRHPGQLIFDEGHHHNAETWQQLSLLTGFAPAIAFTASPYRGSPRGTREFLDFWGDPIWVISYEEAIREGHIAMPTMETLPLVDDDIVEVKGGEFDVTSIESATVDRLGDMAEHCRQWYNGIWDRPTIFSLPSSASCIRFQQELIARHIPSVIVSAETPREERRVAFDATVGRAVCLLHINIVSEGVDLPLRRLVDMAPTLSPVKWVQQIGRITRPTSEPPQYVCTNRNILRHSYILEGVVPTSAIAEAERLWPPTSRGHARVLGLEAIGRFKPTTTKLSSGVSMYVYSLSVNVNGVIVEYCALVHPTQEPIWASKVNTNVDGVRKWGSWQKCDPPDDLKGFASVPPRELSEKQRKWWDRSAQHFGIDPTQEVNRKSFQALPVLADLGMRVL